MIFVIPFFFLLGAVYFAACCSLAFWLAFSKWHLAIRTFAFLAMAFLLGALISSFFRTPLTGPVIVGTTIVAASTAALRWLDFRWISLTREVGREELDRVTGKSIDEWFRLFDEQQARTWSHAQLRACLRERGLADDLQKLIASSYEIFIGRSIVSTTDTGEKLYIDPVRGSVVSRFSSVLREQRSSIREWIFLSLFVAALSMAVRSSGSDWTNANALMLVTAVAMVLSVLNIVIATNCLGLGKQSRLVWAFFVLFTCLIFATLNLIGLARPYQLIVLVIVLQIFVTGFCTALVLFIVRQKGYRLVPVCRTASNVFTPPTLE